MTPAVADFEPHRRYLRSVAYRMLGSAADAEDVVQDAYLRWHSVNREQIADARAFLTRVVVRLSLDQLKSARRRREDYVGPWLPEPLVEDAQPEVERRLSLADDLSVALLLALERLSPLERAAFLLHDVFGQDFSEIAAVLSRSEEACRQLAARARKHVRTARPRFAASEQAHAKIVDAFMAAVRTGDIERLQSVLSAEVEVVTDGGGKVKTTQNIIRGANNVARFFAGIYRKNELDRTATIRQSLVNGTPGLILAVAGHIFGTASFDFEDGRIRTVYIVLNPDKLAHLQAGA